MGNSLATWLTKSPLPSATAADAMSSARASNPARIASTDRGVNKRATNLRSCVCSGASLLMRTCFVASNSSAEMLSSCRGMQPLTLLENSSLRNETSRTSAWRETTQQPPS